MTEEEMLLVNGGEKAKDETVVTVESGDTLSELTAKLNEQNGTDYTYEEIALLNGITDPDTIYAGQTIVFPGTSQPESGSDSGSSGDTPSSPSSSNSTNDATANTVKGPEHHSAYDQQYINEMMEKEQKKALSSSGIQGTAVSGKRIEGQEIKVNPGAGDMTVTERIASEKKKNAGGKIEGNVYKPNEIDSDVRYNAKDYKGEHIMTLKYDDKENYAEFRDYYLTVGQYGTAETISYDGIGLTDEKGNILHILRDEKSILKYSKSLGLPTGPCGDVFLTLELDLVGGMGFEASVSLVVDLDNWKDSGINFSAGHAGGLNVGVGAGVGYVKRELEGSTPIAVDGNFGGALPFSIAAMSDDEGFNGASVSFGPGKGLSTSTQKSYTLSINSVENFFKGLGK